MRPEICGDKIMRKVTLCLLLYFFSKISAVSQDKADDSTKKYAVVVDKMDEVDQARYNAVMNNLTLQTDIALTEVKSRPGVYNFLLNDLPFASACVRELGLGKYVIVKASDLFSEEEISADEKAELDKIVVMDDKDGMNVRAKLIYQEDMKWVYYTYGINTLGITSIKGRAVIVVVARKQDGILLTEARIYARVDGFWGVAGKLMPSVAKSIIEEKSRLFITAAKTVCEKVIEDPDAFYNKLKDNKNIPHETLEKFVKLVKGK